MKAPEHGEEEGGEQGAAPPGWLVKEGTAALGGLLSEPALEYAVAQLTCDAGRFVLNAFSKSCFDCFATASFLCRSQLLAWPDVAGNL